MSILARIDDHEVCTTELVRYLKLNGKFDQIMEDMITDRLTALGARESGVEVTAEEVQQRFDQVRRVHGLHRAKATLEFLNGLSLTPEQFEVYISDMLYKEKIVDKVTCEQAVNEYFSLNSPEFDSIEVGHIVLDSEGSAKEVAAILEDDPDSFDALAREHSLDSATRDNGGVIGTIYRGELQNELEAKVFNAEKGDVVGPFQSGNGASYEIFMVLDKHSATLDDTRRGQVQKKLKESWLRERARNHQIQIL